MSLHFCRVCKDTQPENFYKSTKHKCKSCSRAYANARYNRLSAETKYAERAYQLTRRNNNIFKYRCNAIRSRAKIKQLEFDIDESFLKDLWVHQDGKCFYSGIPMLLTQDAAKYSVSVDRKDSMLGYTKDNVVLCCSIVNNMKSNLNLDEFYSVITNIYQVKLINGS